MTGAVRVLIEVLVILVFPGLGSGIHVDGRVADFLPIRTASQHKRPRDILRSMNKALESLMARAAVWPDEAQAELVASMIDIEARHAGAYRLNGEERSAVLRGLRELRGGELASEEEVAEVFERHRNA
jgi:hypothetical protein